MNASEEVYGYELKDEVMGAAEEIIKEFGKYQLGDRFPSVEKVAAIISKHFPSSAIATVHVTDSIAVIEALIAKITRELQRPTHRKPNR